MHTVAVLAGCKKSALARPLCSIETSVLVGASVLAGGGQREYLPPFGIVKHYVKSGNKTSDAPYPLHPTFVPS